MSYRLDGQLDIFLTQLRNSLPKGAILSDPTQVQGYLHDATRTLEPAMPIAVVRPRTTEQVQTIVQLADKYLIPITPRGAGTGLAAAAVAQVPSVIISSERLQRLDIFPDLRMAVCGPGVLNIDVKNAAQEHGLWYPPDPSSYAICSLGGNVATGAGGMCCVKYGVTRQYVLGLELVLPDGSIVRFGGPRIKDSAGYSLKDLIVGSEGTLGFITQILVRLISKPYAIGTIVATFSSVEAAMDAVDALLQGPIPSVIELVDGEILKHMATEDLMGIDANAGAVLVIQVDKQIYGHNTQKENTQGGSYNLYELEGILNKFNPSEIYITEDPDEGELFLHLRRSAFVTLNRVSGEMFLEDVSTAVANMPKLIRGIKDIGRKYDCHICFVGHAGDGNLHIAIPAEPNDPVSINKAFQVYDEMIRYSIIAGASITGEHGIGRLKRDYLPLQLGEKVMQLHRGIKEVFDPKGIFNPGAVLKDR